ncbi:MAG TPA: hypothetical protein VFA33_13880 [Bryobacteraceae bacterium]|nr:hypothetical protein [Bryobacteraceae bacterium]
MWTRIFLISLLAAAGCLAQNQPAQAAPAVERKFFHLDFVVKELDSGKTINSRAYAMTVATNEKTSIRSGVKLPVPTRPPTGPGINMNYTYVDVGTNIDCIGAKEIQGRLALSVSAEFSSVAPAPEPQSSQPVIRQVRWSAPVIVPLRKPTIVFSSDDPTSKHQMQLELTAAPIQ